jgi:hypothetical protein
MMSRFLADSKFSECLAMGQFPVGACFRSTVVESFLVGKTIYSSRYQVLKGAFLRPSFWAINGLYGLVNLVLFIRDNFLPDRLKHYLQLLDLFHGLPWWGWVIILLCINFLLLAEGATRTVRDREKKNNDLTNELDIIKRSRPRIQPKGSDAAHVLSVQFSPPNAIPFIAPSLRVRFINDPEGSSRSAVARDVCAKVRYSLGEQNVPSLDIDGRWADSDQPSIRDVRQSRNDLLRIDFNLGDEHILDIGFKDPQTGAFFAWNNDVYDYAGFKKPEYRLIGDSIRVEIRLRAPDVDEKFVFRFVIEGDGLRIVEQLREVSSS